MVRAVMYGIQVFYSYLLMLVAMTYQVTTPSLSEFWNLRLNG